MICCGRLFQHAACPAAETHGVDTAFHSLVPKDAVNGSYNWPPDIVGEGSVTFMHAVDLSWRGRRHDTLFEGQRKRTVR